MQKVCIYFKALCISTITHIFQVQQATFQYVVMCHKYRLTETSLWVKQQINTVKFIEVNRMQKKRHRACGLCSSSAILNKMNISHTCRVAVWLGYAAWQDLDV